MTISQAGVDLIKRFEGLRLKSYLCPAGVWTIGYGTTKGIVEGMTCTKAAAEELLKRDLVSFQTQVEALVTAPVTQNQFDALVSFAYNVGIGAFSSSRLLTKLNSGNDAELEFMRWVHGGGKVLPGLVLRRQAERDLFSKFSVTPTR